MFLNFRGDISLAWHVHTHDGHRYGPIEKAELDEWIAEGRLTAHCQVMQDGEPWRRASEVFPVLRYTVGGGPSPSTGAENPYASSQHAGHGPVVRPGGYTAPDRGALILTLGILGLVICGLLCIPAWAMGANDLREMRAGRMDPTNYGLTQAGMVCGIVGCIFMILGVVILVFVFTVAGV